MKYLLLSLSLLIPSISHADSITSGVGLIIISTGVNDPTRNYGDKINENMRVIAATITNINTSISNIATDTSTVLTLLKSTAVQVSNHISAANSTMSALGSSTQTLRTDVNAFNNFNSTGDTLISNLLTWTTTATTRIDQGQVSQSTVSSYLSNGALAVYDEGTVQGNATTVNFVGANVAATQSGSTTTVTVTGGSGSSTGNSTFTITLGYGGSLMHSTNTVSPVPGLSFNTGSSTFNVVSIQAMIMRNSTVAMTTFDLVESSGGINALPLLTKRFPTMVVSTALASGAAGWSTPLTTGVSIPSNYWLGVHIPTAPVSGQLPIGVNIHLRGWTKPYGGD